MSLRWTTRQVKIKKMYRREDTLLTFLSVWQIPFFLFPTRINFLQFPIDSAYSFMLKLTCISMNIIFEKKLKITLWTSTVGSPGRFLYGEMGFNAFGDFINTPHAMMNIWKGKANHVLPFNQIHFYKWPTPQSN